MEKEKNNIAAILESIQGLGKQELIALNQEIVDMIKRKNEKDAAKASEMFKKGDIVHFKDPSGGDDVYGVVKKKNQKTFQIHTTDGYLANVPATFLAIVANPSKKLLNLRKEVQPSFEDMFQTMEKELKGGKDLDNLIKIKFRD